MLRPTSALELLCATFDPPHEDHLNKLLEWARHIARKTAKAYGHAVNSDEANLVASEANLALLNLASSYNPSFSTTGKPNRNGFCGWARREVQTKCVREADRLRGGGTFDTCRPAHRPTVTALGDAAGSLPDTAASEIGAEPMSRRAINGKIYALPFEQLLKPLTSAEYDSLYADIAINEVQKPLTTATIPNLGPSLLDGANRARIAGELKLSVPLIDLGIISYDYALDRAKALNAEGRQFTAAEVKALRADRIEGMVRDREQGYSYRVIGDRHGVSHTQARREITAASGTIVPKPPPTTAEIVSRAAKALDIAFRQIGVLLAGAMRDRMIDLAEELDIPFDDVRPGKERWEALSQITHLRGVLARLA